MTIMQNPKQLFIGLILVAGIVGLSYRSIMAQPVDSWNTYTSLADVDQVLLTGDGDVIALTSGGLYTYTPGGSLLRWSTVDGLYRLRATTMAYDAVNEGIWLGYIDGTFEFFSPERGTIQRYSDIARSTRFQSKRINRMIVNNGELFIATDFGVVVFDTGRRIVIDTYSNLGRFESAVNVRDIAIVNNRIYVATQSGFATADLANPNLVEPSAWDNSDGQGNYGNLRLPLNALGISGGEIYAATSTNNYRFSDSDWQITGLFGAIPVRQFRYVSGSEALIGITSQRITVVGGATYALPGTLFNTAAIDSDRNTLYAGTPNRGLAMLNPLNATDWTFLNPDGPFMNAFAGMNSSDGILISGSSPGPGRAGFPAPATTGYYIFRDGGWSSYNTATAPELTATNFNSTFVSAFSSNYYVFGSWGRGAVLHNRETDEIRVLNQNTSPLEPIAGSSTFIVITGIDTDTRGNVWFVCYAAATNTLQMYDFAADEWTLYPNSAAITATDRYYSLTIDSFDQKWITLTSSTGAGRGLLLIGSDNSDAVKLTSAPTQGNLPNDLVNAVVQDKRGEIWLATERGIARYLFPDRVLSGTAQDRQASFLINEDTTAASPFLLRDLNATGLAVDAANRKWIASRDNGVWLIDENGRRVIRHFTTDNSPLPSNRILSITVDEKTGTVFMATEEGLISYTDIPREGARRMDDLFVYPNPYSYRQNTGPVVIDGLSDRTTISILTVDGRLVNRAEARSGRASWDVRDFQGNRVATGVYMIVAVDENNAERGVGKVVIIR
jgi:hypothetical protein